jgi:hypothetical protein
MDTPPERGVIMGKPPENQAWQLGETAKIMGKKNESLMTVKLDGDIHNVKYYNDDTGYGETTCGKMVGPWDVTICGKFDCKTCLEGK